MSEACQKRENSTSLTSVEQPGKYAVSCPPPTQQNNVPGPIQGIAKFTQAHSQKAGLSHFLINWGCDGCFSFFFSLFFSHCFVSHVLWSYAPMSGETRSYFSFHTAVWATSEGQDRVTCHGAANREASSCARLALHAGGVSTLRRTWRG